MWLLAVDWLILYSLPNHIGYIYVVSLAILFPKLSARCQRKHN